MKTITLSDLKKVSGGAVNVYLDDTGYRVELTNGSELSIQFPQMGGGYWTQKSDGIYSYDKDRVSKASLSDLKTLGITMSTNNGCTIFSHVFL